MASTGTCARRPSRARGWAFALALACAGAAAQGDERSLEVAPGQVVRYRLIEGTAGSARPTAEKLLRHLAEGDIESAALLSSAPKRRFEELAKYRAAVGEAEFKRVYARYFVPANRLVAEVAVGAHRLLVWELGEAQRRLAGQFYVEIDGRFLLDDVPSETRQQLRQVLNAYRAGKIRF